MSDDTRKNSESKPEEQGRLSEAEIRRKQQNPNEAVGDEMEDHPPMTPDAS